MVTWKVYPRIQIDSPVLALAAGQGFVWAGGAGGVARYQSSWVSCSSGLPIASVAALVFTCGWLFAGGADGIARSKDGGETWEPGVIEVNYPVMCLTTSPNYEKDFTVLAGTLGGGILRSDDAGRTWKTANFGLQNNEILSLTWNASGMILAGTSDGIYRSTNGGRAWRAAEGSEGLSVSGLAILSGGWALASLETGGLLSSTNSGASWMDYEPQYTIEGSVGSLIGLDDHQLLMGVPGNGTFRSLDNGKTWKCLMNQAAVCFAAGSSSVYLGIGDVQPYGVMELVQDSLHPLPPPALHDLRILVIVNQVPVVAGLHSGAYIWKKKTWQPLLVDAGAVTALAQASDGSLVLSCEQGLLLSVDSGNTWQTVLKGESGMVARLTFRSDGQGWAASGDGGRLLHTCDNGQTWESLKAPFGVLPLAALQATNRVLIAATYDTRQQIAQIWYSQDNGKTWKRGLEAQTPWPIVTVAGHPPLITLGGTVFVLHPKGNWIQHTIRPGAGVRRIVGRGSLILALTSQGLFRSSDRGNTWSEEPDCPSSVEITDLLIGEDRLFVLLSGGQVWSRPLVIG
jgi:photosystem II stability/assembly factor-like uncharacterized protein